MISRTSCAQRQLLAIRSAQTIASSRSGTSMIENPPTTALVSGNGPSVEVPSVPTIVARWRRSPHPKIHTPAALASRTTACEASPTAGQSPSGMWSIEPSSNEIKYRGTSAPSGHSRSLASLQHRLRLLLNCDVQAASGKTRENPRTVFSVGPNHSLFKREQWGMPPLGPPFHLAQKSPYPTAPVDSHDVNSPQASAEYRSMSLRKAPTDRRAWHLRCSRVRCALGRLSRDRAGDCSCGPEALSYDQRWQG